eukprot:m.230761 g.230761  ORF g.230761 m.230761 type:complete len:125 (+) comp17357_c0_seq1:3660-4034(+)
MPPATRWIPYIMPTRYLLRGSLIAYLSDQDFFDPPTDTFISGKDILKSLFDIDDNKWLMLLAGLGFALLFRLQHYFFMYRNLSKLGAALTTSEDTSIPPTRTNTASQVCVTVFQACACVSQLIL